MKQIVLQAKEAKKAARLMFSISSEMKNEALKAIADALLSKADLIIKENLKDLEAAAENSVAMPLQKRLLFDKKKINDVCDGLIQLSKLEDPVGRSLLSTSLDEGLSLYRISCPIGVIGVIFESRPDALVQIASLCLKSGNAVFLKGGSEAARTNRVLFEIIEQASTSVGMPKGWISLLESREEVAQMFELNEYIDLLIPRGSNEFVRYIMEHSKIPVLGHADGVCHVYVHEKADPEMAVRIVVDSKTQYVAVCNAAETLLIDETLDKRKVQQIADALKSKGVALYGCERASALLHIPCVDDWHKEYLNLEMSIRIVKDISQAVEHINTYGSGHTDSIVTTCKDSASFFLDAVDSGNVFWNCSTRFADGFKYGFGAEVGVSTSKIHARGPVGLEGMMTYKYKLFGNGQVVEDYAKGKKTFKHRPIIE